MRALLRAVAKRKPFPSLGFCFLLCISEGSAARDPLRSLQVLKFCLLFSVPDPVLSVSMQDYLAPGPYAGDLLLSHGTEDKT